MTSPSKRDAAFGKGKLDFLCGISISENPYAKSDVDHADSWTAGWTEAQQSRDRFRIKRLNPARKSGLVFSSASGPVRLTNEAVETRNMVYPYSSVSGLGRYHRISTLCTMFVLPLLQGEYMRISIQLENPEHKIVLENSVGLVGTVGKFDAAYNLLQERTFVSRLNRYLIEFERENAFHYSGLRFTADGAIEAAKYTANVRQSALSVKPFKFQFKDLNGVKRSCSTEIDADVFFLLLEKIYGIKYN